MFVAQVTLGKKVLGQVRDLVPLGGSGNLSTNMKFIKVPKCASSTSGGIARRIAAHYGMAHVFDGSIDTEDPAFDDDVEPRVYANHIKRSELDAHNDVKNLRLPFFPTWTMIRHPAERLLSQYYYFEITNGHKDPNDQEAMVAYLNSTSNFLFNYIRPAHCDDDTSVLGAIDCVLDAYDFVGVVELYDQSMVQLADKLNLPLTVVTYLKAKVSTEHDDLQYQSEPVKEFFRSQPWLDKNYKDIMLWEEVMRRVAIAATDYVLDQKLTILRSMLDTARSQCETRKFKGNCYWRDNGCGYPCIDALFGK